MKKKWATVKCKTCGKKFQKRACWIKRTKNHFCGYSCNGKERARNLVKFSGNMKGRERRDKKFGPANPSWKGGVTYWRKHGNYPPIKYVRCPEAFLPMARKDGYIMEHRLLMAKHLGRLLNRAEVVHHKNHDPHDNRIENLELFESNQIHKKTEGTRGEYARSAAAS